MSVFVLSFLFIISAITPVFAAGDQAFDVMSLLPIVLIFGVFYFLLLRPQQKKMKSHQELLNNLRKGDRVTTSGGIIGVVQKTTEKEVVLDVGDNVRLTFVKQMITEVIAPESTALVKNNTPKESTPKAASSKKKVAQKTDETTSSSSDVSQN